MEDKEFKNWLSEHAEGFSLKPSEGAFDKVMAGLEKERKQRLAGWVYLFPAFLLMLTAGVFAWQNFHKQPVPIMAAAHQEKNPTASSTTVNPFEISSGSGTAQGTPTEPQPSVVRENATTYTTQGGISNHPGNSSHTYGGKPVVAGSNNAQTVIHTTVGTQQEKNTASTSGGQAGMAEILSQQLNDVSLLAGPIGQKPLNIKNKVDKSIKPVRINQKKDVIRPRFSVGFYIEPFIGRSFFTANPTGNPQVDDKSQGYVSSRKTEEMWHIGYSGGVMAEYNVAKGFNIGLGVGYSKMMNTEVLQQSYYYSYIASQSILDSFVFTTSSGVDTMVYVTTAISTPFLANDTLRQAFTNTYDYIEIPLNLSYDFHFGKLALRLNGGLTAGILVQTRSLQILNNGQLPEIVDNLEQSRNTRLLLNLTTGVEVGYTFGRNWTVFAGPSARFAVNSLFDKDYPIVQKPFTLGLRSGLRYRF